MAKHFLSYSRQDPDEVVMLANQLKARGLTTWQDVSDLSVGRPTEEQIRHALAQDCGACVVYLTKESLESDYIMKVELRAALKRQENDPGFAIIPVFRGVSIEEAKEATVKALGRDITLFDGVKISAPKRISTDQARSQLRCELGRVGRRALEASLKRYASSFAADAARKPILDVHTRQYTRQPHPPDLDLDWRPFFDDGGGLPSQAEWSDTLLPSLADIEQGIAEEYGTCTLHIRAKAHLSVGVALGFTFLARTGFHLDVVQYEDIWTTSCSPQEGQPLGVSGREGPVHAKGLAVELSVTGDVGPEVDKFVRARGQGFRARVTLEPRGGWGRDAVAGTEHALAMAIQVAMEIRRLRAEYGTDKTHVFAMMPLALGVLLGHQLNACGPIQLYEYDNRRYQPSCLLVRAFWDAGRPRVREPAPG